MFLTNKYTNWYNSIVNNAKTRILDQYSEKHHIIPKCLGGTNQISNLVKLTAKEHYVCHKLLARMVTGDARHKMNIAIYRMSHSGKNHNRIKIQSSEYELIRSTMAKSLSELRKGKSTGPKSAETRAKMSFSRTGKKLSADIKEKISKSKLGLTHSQETKEKMQGRRSSRLGAILTKETKLKMSNAAKGRILTDEHRQKLKIAAGNRKKTQKLCI